MHYAKKPISRPQKRLLAKEFGEFAHAFSEELSIRFGGESMKLLDSFRIFDPKFYWHKGWDQFGGTYGQRELQALYKHFCGHGTRCFITPYPQVFNEWPLVKRELFNFVNMGRYREQDMIDPSAVWAQVAILLKGKAPAILRLVRFMFTLSVHTADVERGFSQFGIVKTELRNKLSPTVMDAQLRVKLHVESDEIGNEQSAVVRTAAELWVGTDGATRGNLAELLQPLARKLHEAVAKFHQTDGDVLTEAEAKELAHVFGMEATVEPTAQQAEEQPDCGSDG